MKEFLSGNEAAARGAYEAGVSVAAGYPGTPSTEIIESIANYPEIYAEWAPNEKVAFDVAMGGSLGGARVLTAMKHVGVNVAMDSLMTFSYTDASGGFVLVSADDPGMFSSQDEQDNRYIARFAGIPLLEPSDSQETKDFVIYGIKLSEAFQTPVMVRLTTRVSHSRCIVELGERETPPTPSYSKDMPRFVMMPQFARKQHVKLLEKLKRLEEEAEGSTLNRVEMNDRSIGIITSGITYQHVKEVLPHASFLKIGFSHPLPMERIRSFASMVDRLIVVEELEPFMEEQIRAAGLTVEGKEHFTRVGELTPDLVEGGLIGAGVIPKRTRIPISPAASVERPPVLCAGCPHTGLYMALGKLKATVMGDIGCYTLAALPPLNSIDTCIAMGCSIGMAAGMSKALQPRKKIVATIGDSTFLHSGIAPLLNAVYNKSNIVVVILDNGSTSMTGGQDHPGTGLTITGEATRRVDLAELCRALGVEDVHVVDPYNYDDTLSVLRKSLSAEGTSVVITNRPCVLYPEKLSQGSYRVVSEDCIGCPLCLRTGCPAISLSGELTEKRKKKVRIDPESCVGCSLCAQVCPADSIIPVET